MDYAGRVVVITGAGSGMGRAYAQEFARRGATLALNDWDAEALAGTAALLPPQTRVLAEVYDVSDRAATEAFAAQVQTALGKATVVVNNAGIEGAGRPIWDTDPASSDRVMAVNYAGVVHGTRAFLPQLLANDAGAIVNVSSVFGLIGVPHQADYCASKFAVRGFTEALAVELLQTHIDVHLVHPGGVATNIARREETQAFAGKYLKTPPDEIARGVIDAIGSRRTRIVVGHRSRTIWLASHLLPLRLLGRVLRRELSPVLPSGTAASKPSQRSPARPGRATPGQSSAAGSANSSRM